MKIDAYIQARMGSQRLPGKMMLPIGGKPIIQHIIEHTLHGMYNYHGTIALLTTDQREDDVLCDVARSNCIEVVREYLPIDRYMAACVKYSPDWFFRICGDGLCVKRAAYDWLIMYALLDTGTNDYFAFTDGEQKRPSSSGRYPEIIKRKSFIDHVAIIDDHVTIGMYGGAASRCGWILAPNSKRVTIDTQSDYDAICRVIDELGYVPDDFEVKNDYT